MDDLKPDISTARVSSGKTLSELKEWWLKGVANMAKKPLADWKTDNPAHPRYDSKRVVKPWYD